VRPVCTRTHNESIARMALTQQPVRHTGVWFKLVEK
jgi:hypothetical protein